MFAFPFSEVQIISVNNIFLHTLSFHYALLTFSLATQFLPIWSFLEIFCYDAVVAFAADFDHHFHYC